MATPLFSGASGTPSPLSLGTPRRANIFVIEDSAELRQALEDVLACQGYAVRGCADALEALDELERGATPDLIVFDLVMPRMNGWEFRLEQRKRPKLAGIPVIALSGDASPKAQAIDADAYLRKPVEERDLLDTVERLLVSLERTRLEAKSVELERLTSLGLLAAGIAHEVNNPLAFLAGNLELALRKSAQLEAHVPPELREPLRELSVLLGHAERGAERIQGVVRSVSTFSRPDDERVVPMDVREVLDSSIRLVSNELRHRAELVRDYQEPPRVLGNAAKLGQVFLNLLMNAAHAIGEGSTARDHVVKVATRRSPEGRAVVEITDTGRGIAPEVASRIFDPFFSTKAVGTGRGLGLTISQRLLTSMGGSISVESQPGRGSTFRIELPPLGEGEREGSSKAPAKGPLERAPSPSQRENRAPIKPRILVIDDEPMMCELLNAMLRDDYDVSVMTSPCAALDALRAGESFDLILSDLMMPELSGIDLYAAVASERPNQAQRMLFMTGGTFTERAAAFLDRLEDPQLHKPFRHHEVKQIICERLAKEARRASN